MMTHKELDALMAWVALYVRKAVARSEEAIESGNQWSELEMAGLADLEEQARLELFRLAQRDQP